MGLLDLPTLTPGHSGTPVCPFTSINLGRFFSVQFETNLPDFAATAYPMAQWSNQILVGGFNPFEQYSSNWITSPSRAENKKYKRNHHLE